MGYCLEMVRANLDKIAKGVIGLINIGDNMPKVNR